MVLRTDHRGIEISFTSMFIFTDTSLSWAEKGSILSWLKMLTSQEIGTNKDKPHTRTMWIDLRIVQMYVASSQDL